MNDYDRISRRSYIEAVFIGVCFGMLIMFGLVAAQYYTGLMDGKELAVRVSKLEKIVQTIDERLRIAE